MREEIVDCGNEETVDYENFQQDSNTVINDVVNLNLIGSSPELPHISQLAHRSKYLSTWEHFRLLLTQK